MTSNAESFGFQPIFVLGTVKTESPEAQDIIDSLGLQSHVEGGYFVRTDKDKSLVPNPFLGHADTETKTAQQVEDDYFRGASSSFLYFFTPKNPQGVFHRYRCRII